MKLKYKILWIDDEYNAISRDKKDIIKYITDLGFECIDETDIIVVKNFDELKEKIKYKEMEGYEKTADYDLLLVDLNLGHETGNGDYIIKEIRQNEVYCEIIFYSSNYEELKSKLKNEPLEGVFTSDRLELIDKTKKVISLTLKKVQDVNNLRGLIMAEVADLDILKEEIITLASQKFKNKELEKYALKKIKKSVSSTNNQAEEKLKDIDNVDFTRLFENIGFIDSNKKAMILGEALAKLNINEPVTKETFTQPYIDNILKTRNKFAHVKESDWVDEKGNTCKKIDDIPFTEKKCIEIRKDISKYKDILLKLKTQM